MQITTKPQAKTIVSALRRELKALDKPSSSLSHNDCLSLMAKALGFPSWNAWEATLQDAEVAKPVAPESKSKYPLVNNGQFDFVSVGDEGVPFSGMLVPLEGTHERIYGTAGVNSVTRAKKSDGSMGYEVEYGGGTDVDWDSQVTLRGADGHKIWLDDSATHYSGAQLVLLPEDCADPDDEELMVRQALLSAYRDYIDENNIDARALQGDYDSIAEVLGFALTIAESEALYELLS